MLRYHNTIEPTTDDTPRGSGKTTTVRILTGLSASTAGDGWVAGQPGIPEAVIG
jgi:ABC-type multidrug transport system ATPase subunit